MKRHILAIVAAVLLSGVLNAAPQKGYKITVSIKNAKDTVLYLGYYLGKYTPAMDTARINKKGQFVFSSDTATLKSGVYFFSNPQGRYAEFIVNLDKPNYTFKTDEANWITNMQVSGSPENKAFYEYQCLTHKYFNLSDSVQKNTPDKELGKQRARELRRELDGIQEGMISQHPEFLFCRMLKAVKEVEVPVVDEKGDTLTRQQRAEYYGDHYFDNMSLDCNAMLRTPPAVFYDRVERFFNGYLGQASPDVICEYADKVIDMARPAKDVFQFLVNYLAEKYLQSHVMTHDAVYVHMIEKYYATGEATWASPSDIDSEVERATKWKRLLVGQMAPDFGVLYKEQWHHLNDIKNKYTLLIFWSPTCGHCATMIPAIHDFYKKHSEKYDIGTFAINTDIHEEDKWLEFIKDKNLYDWNNYNGGVANVDWKDLYDVVSTPVIYLLDQNHKILAKKVDAKILSEIFKILEPGFEE